MDSDLYDEFGNYIGPELESDEEEEELPPSPEPENQDFDVRKKSNNLIPTYISKNKFLFFFIDDRR